jgi:hypothetical protein
MKAQELFYICYLMCSYRWQSLFGDDVNDGSFGIKEVNEM